MAGRLPRTLASTWTCGAAIALHWRRNIAWMSQQCFQYPFHYLNHIGFTFTQISILNLLKLRQ